MSAAAVPVVGIVGGGQLARMTQQAAIPLGVPLRVFAAAPDDSAASVVSQLEVGDHRDLHALRRFAKGVDVLTFDHEHVPTAHLRALEAAGVTLRPGAAALQHAQDKVLLRERLGAAGLPGPRWRVVSSAAEVAAFAAEAGWPVVLKAPRGGYDGRGVWLAEDVADAAETLAGRGPLLVEERVGFARELAALVARSPHGQAAAYPVVETVQRGGVCVEVVAPAPDLPAERAGQAQELALRIAAELGVTGLLAVELFDTGTDLLVNELAMRPHNSGHWTIEGAVTSQFEQHLRAVLDLPLGETRPLAPYTVMANVFGGHPDLYGGLPHCLARDPALHVHLYGKAVRPGRKVGHVTALGADLAETRARVRHAAAYLQGDLDG